MTYSTRHLDISLIFYKDIKLTSCQSVRGLSHLTDCKVKQQNIEIFTFLVKNYEEMKKKKSAALVDNWTISYNNNI